MRKKRCPKCGKDLPLSKFGVRKSKNILKYHSYCKKCRKQYSREWYLKNTEKAKQSAVRFKKQNPIRCLNYLIKSQLKKYGLTIEQYNKILKQQNYKCAICGKTEKENKQRLSVDHSHKTSFVRGLLCKYCNGRLLQYLRDSKRHAVGLIYYLQNAVDNDKDWK